MQWTWLNGSRLLCVWADGEFVSSTIFHSFVFPCLCSSGEVGMGQWPQVAVTKKTVAKLYQTSQRQLQRGFRCARTRRWKNRRCNIQMSDQSLQEGRGWKDCGLDLGRHTSQNTCTLQQEAKRIYYLRTVHPDGLNEELQITDSLGHNRKDMETDLIEWAWVMQAVSCV